MHIKVNKKEYKKLVALTDRVGYSSVEECVEHIIDKSIKNIDSGMHDFSKVRERLRGLGYID